MLSTWGEKYDLSAPWRTLNMTANPLALDVFGRIIAYKSITRYLAELMVVNPKQVPVGYKAG